eukprot:Gregarina_sp_Poly_1__6205@NODE_328_length_9480_cov_62_396048_g50_i1_p2_GENE_NODE_328_length_9480_cov_62_396048_g50_i1NODE_328_length_9480_cov_62_396048_g50_i1_p2_ORF_typecomplete_len263_score19_67RNase_Zc3h12a/PF11977_8/0_0054_NODE_328_length_9480_cov_62_396048_g50_i132344022
MSQYSLSSSSSLSHPEKSYRHNYSSRDKLDNGDKRRIAIPQFSTFEDAKRIYTPPLGYVWRPVVVDTLNFLAKELGPDWPKRGYGGTLMAQFAVFLTELGVRVIKFTLSRSIVDKLLSRQPSSSTIKDRNDFVWLFSREYIMVAPSFITVDEIGQATTHPESSMKPFTIKKRTIGFNPWKVNDDLITLHVGMELDSVLVSGDRFKDLKKYLPSTQLHDMFRVLRQSQVTATRLDVKENVWRLAPANENFYSWEELPFWRPKC